jgi:hypothetical protein
MATGCGWNCQILNFKAQWSQNIPPMITICTASGHYMYRHFNIQQFYVLPTQNIYVFCVDLRTNSDYVSVNCVLFAAGTLF